MKQRCVSAFARGIRALRGFALAAVALGVGAMPLLAQASTGKLEGRVRDQTGTPIADAQVLIVGTAFSAQTNAEGYYFINNVPAGEISVRAAFVGYRPTEVRNVRMLAGQTITQDITLEATPFEVQELTVVAAEQPLVPRDEVTTKQRISGEYTARLPVDRVSQVLALQPGVVASANGEGLSIRGGRQDEAATYVDGVPVQPGNRGTGFVAAGFGSIQTGGGSGGISASGSGFTGSGGSSLVVGTNALEEASVTTGASSSEFGNAQAGIISMQTRGGSASEYSGSLGFETDDIFPSTTSIGFNAIQGSVGGPVPIVSGLSFFVSGVLQGQESADPGLGAEDVPIFVQAGVDTVVDNEGELVAIDNFAVAQGDCDLFANSVNEEIANNFGEDCDGIRTPGSNSSAYQLQAKLNYSYGTGSRIAATHLRSQNQRQLFDYSDLYNPDARAGDRTWNEVYIVNWTQNLSKSAERALALDVSFSYQTDRYLQGNFAVGHVPGSGTLNFYLKPFEFRHDFDSFPLDDELVNNYRLNQGRRTPIDLDRRGEFDELDAFRNNAYGLLGFSEAQPGGDLFLFLGRENRTIGKAALDWQVDRYNRVKLGGEFTDYHLESYAHNINSQFFSDVWIEDPIRWNAFVEDRLDLGDVVLVGGLRYDYYDSKASRPQFTCTAAEDADDGQVNGFCGETLAVGDVAFFPRISSMPGFDPANPTAQFVEDESHSYLSPHIQVSFPVTDRTNFRLSYAHQVQAPDFAVIYSSINTDLGITNTNSVWGSDLDFGRTIAFEFGIRHAFSDDMVLDVAAYNKDNLANASGRIVNIYDPVANANTDVRVMTNADFGNTRGIDLRLDRRFGNLFNGTLAYSYQQAKSTGTDPLTYINLGSRIINEITGTNQVPPQATSPLATSRPHSLAMAASLTFPNDWQEGTALGTVLENVSVFTTFRYASGTAYTDCTEDSGNEATLSGQVCAKGGFEGGQLNTSRLPTFKQLDMRFTKGFSLGGIEATAYFDARNILNFRNVLAVFVDTEDVVNEENFALKFAGDSLQFFNEGDANGVVTEDGALDLTFGGAGAGGCAGWLNSDEEVTVPNCLYLIRAEQRFGDGDGVFTLAEQRAASEADYEAGGTGGPGTAFGEQALLGPGRRLRVGLELNF